MLRIVGAFCIIAGSTGIGLWYREQLRAALSHLRYMKRLLELFAGEIRYQKAALPECCRQIGEKAREPYRTALLKIYEELKMQDGCGFAEKWRKIMESALNTLPLTGGEKELFVGCFGGYEFSDGATQQRMLEQSRDMLGVAIESREVNLEKQGHLAAGLGVMGGMLLTVLLL